MHMSKIWLITKREYLSRVKKKSFIVMTLLGPLLIALFYGLIFYFVLNPNVGSKEKKIAVFDMNKNLFSTLESDEKISFVFLNANKPEDTLIHENYDGILIIHPADSNLNIKTIDLKCKTNPGLGIKKELQNKIEDILTDAKLTKNGLVTKKEFEKYKSEIQINTKSEDEEGDNNSQEISAGIGFACAFLIYIFIFLYGVQVMRGVIEEKTNRIVEVIISSVKPFQLMMGKIIGIAMVGLTQFTVWLIFGFATVSFGGAYINKDNIEKVKKAQTEMSMNKMNVENQALASNTSFDKIMNFNYPLIIGCFLFYFIAGYLFYGAFFAAIGSAVDSETDTQQFMLPVTLPLVFGFIIATTSVVNDYNSTLASILSIIPFTAPVVMMVRIPFINEFNVEILMSMISMVVSFILVVWMAGKIYRVGILMYGKKPSYKEILKWIRY
jgi:ABC-2 type transport system permease protein